MNTKRALTAVAAAALLAATATAASLVQSQAQAQAQSCTPTWQLVETPPLPSALGSALGPPAVVSHSNVWFPSDDNPAGPVPGSNPGMLRWNGKAVVAAPEPVTMPLMLKSTTQASFDSRTDGWVMGSFTNSGLFFQQYFAHWDGRRWTIMPFTGPLDKATVEGHTPALSGVAAVSPTDAWAVGALDVAPFSGDAKGAIIEHWDGSTWSVVPNPASAPSSGGRLDALKVISATDVWAAGRRQNASGTDIPLVEHWDGKAWHIVPVPSGASPSVLSSISGSGAHDIWVAGGQLRPGTTNIAAPLVEHWDGTAWHVASLPDIGANGAKATGIYAASSGDAWVTNLVAPNPGTPGVFLHWDGTNWTKVQVPGPQEFGVTSQYSGIAGTGPDDVWAAGFTTSRVTGEEAVAAHLTCG
jgi:hypothetical protein